MPDPTTTNNLLNQILQEVTRIQQKVDEPKDKPADYAPQLKELKQSLGGLGSEASSQTRHLSKISDGIGVLIGIGLAKEFKNLARAVWNLPTHLERLGAGLSKYLDNVLRLNQKTIPEVLPAFKTALPAPFQAKVQLAQMMKETSAKGNGYPGGMNGTTAGAKRAYPSNMLSLVRPENTVSIDTGRSYFEGQAKQSKKIADAMPASKLVGFLEMCQALEKVLSEVAKPGGGLTHFLQLAEKLNQEFAKAPDLSMAAQKQAKGYRFDKWLAAAMENAQKVPTTAQQKLYAKLAESVFPYAANVQPRKAKPPFYPQLSSFGPAVEQETGFMRLIRGLPGLLELGRARPGGFNRPPPGAGPGFGDMGSNGRTPNIALTGSILPDLIGGFGKLAVVVPAVVGGLLTLAETGAKFVELLNPGLAYQFNQAMRDLGATIGTAFAPMLEQAIVFLRNLADAIAPLMAALGDFLQGVFEIANALMPIVEVLASIGSIVLSVISPVLHLLAQIFTILLAPLRLVARLFEVLAKAFGAFGRIFVKLLAPILELFGKLMEKLLEPLLKFIEFLESIFGGREERSTAVQPGARMGDVRSVVRDIQTASFGAAGNLNGVAQTNNLLGRIERQIMEIITRMSGHPGGPFSGAIQEASGLAQGVVNILTNGLFGR